MLSPVTAGGNRLLQQVGTRLEKLEVTGKKHSCTLLCQESNGSNTSL